MTVCDYEFGYWNLQHHPEKVKRTQEFLASLTDEQNELMAFFIEAVKDYTRDDTRMQDAQSRAWHSAED